MIALLKAVMSNPFYKNHSPFKISEIFETLNIKFDNVILDKEVFDIKDLYNANNNEITFLHSKKYRKWNKIKKKYYFRSRIRKIR